MFPLSFSIVSELLYGKLLETFIILSVILLPIKLLFASAVFCFMNCFFEEFLSASVAGS